MQALKLYTLLLFLFIGFLPHGKTQSGLGLAKLEPSYVNHFEQEEASYANQCFSNAILDKQGRLWLAPCTIEQVINHTRLFQFDGYQFRHVDLLLPEGKSLNRPILLGVNQHGRLFGWTPNSQLFFVDPDTWQTSIISISDSTFHKKNLQFRNAIEKQGEMIVSGFTNQDSVFLFKLENNALIEQYVLGSPDIHWGSPTYPLIVDSTEIWLSGGTLPLLQIVRPSGRVKQYTNKDFDSNTLVLLADNSSYSQSPTLLKRKDGQLYTFLPSHYGNLLFRFDRKTARFLPMDEQFPADWVPQNIFRDAVGNLCFLFLDQQSKYQALLMTGEGQLFDYSAIVAEKKQIQNIVAQDFQQQVFLLGNKGLVSVGIRQKEAIKNTLKGHWISSMAELPNGRILVNTVKDGWFIYDPISEQYEAFQGPKCGIEPAAFGKGMKQQIIPDAHGNFWFTSNKNLVRYNPSTNQCETFLPGIMTGLFGLVSKDRMIIQSGRQSVVFFDPITKEKISVGPGIPEHFQGFIRDIFIDTKGLIWIPTNNGLWCIDIEKNQSRLFDQKDGFADSRFTSIYEDEQGKFWLGTYFGGLHIYDPQSGAIQILDEHQGLSNNAVMSIQVDLDGDIWVGTEKGITIVSKEGQIRSSINQKDGLLYDKFERFDPLITKDGHLYFGSRQGLNIIDPDLLKSTFKKDKKIQIFLSELRFYSKKEGKEIIQNNSLHQQKTIYIPAKQPSLFLKFGLSNYLEPKQNNYAYRIDKKGEDWHYLGRQPELYINYLPPGKYRLLIKGADFRNNWTEPISIDIHAQQFFYKKIWFYLLAALPFLAFALIWIRNKQLEAQRLETEVTVRTQKIQNDKVLIEHQAEKLERLDAIKTRFFVNVSHELRTPVTLVKTPLEHLIQKYGHKMDKHIRQNLARVLKNANGLVKLVEELLEFSNLNEGKPKLQNEPTPISIYCRTLFNAHRPLIELKQIEYTFKSTIKEDSFYLVDQNRLEKIINNLLVNALKFTSPGGFISMNIDQKAEELIIEVKDSGQGIPEEDLPYIFDPYFQTENRNLSGKGGFGIGLAISKEQARLMKGNLSVKSQWGVGATFYLHLPAQAVSPVPEYKNKEIPVQTNMLANKPELIKPISSRALSKILIVEDNLDMQNLLHSILSDHYKCIIAQNGTEAWLWLEEEKPEIQQIELILSDLMMPEMDGYQLLNKIKVHPRWQGLPVIILTARAEQDNKLDLLRMGVDDYMLKPFSPEELTVRVKNLMENYRSRTEAKLEKKNTPLGIAPEFESVDSADLLWLMEVENAAKEALEKRIKLSTSFLANKVFVSERHFLRKLKTITGLTPNNYIQEIKLQKARYLMENKVHSTVAEVAQGCGYNSASYLAKIYQERFGKSPRDYYKTFNKGSYGK